MAFRSVSVVPRHGWWFATWSGDSAAPWISVDICTPAAFVNGEWTYVDLELDPHRSHDGRVWVDDEDEFAAACDAGTISSDEQVAARAATSDIERRLRQFEEPFGTAGWAWLRQGIDMALPPLTELR